MKRSEFLKGLIGAVTAAGLPPILAVDEPRRIGASPVEECRQALGRLYTLDVQLVEAARATVGAPSPRLASLLSAREALGHGRSGDRAAAGRAIAAARSLLDRGPSAADPDWIGFWNAADLASHEAKALRLAGYHAGVERSAREAATLAGATAPRNAAFYRGQLAETLAEHGDLDEAIDLARPLVLAGRSESRRVQRMLDGTVAAIGRRGPQRGVEFARWAEMVAS